MRSWQYFVLLVGLSVDQLSKHLSQGFLSFWVAKPIIPNILFFQLVHNYGAAYGIFQHQRLFLLCVSAIVIFGGFFFSKSICTSIWARWGLTLLLIGAIGNFIDRLFLGYVIDFIDIRIFPVFNVADVCIDAGIVCFLIDTFFQSRIVSKQKPSENA